MAFKIFSVSSVSTLLTAFYIYASLRGVYNLMHPLSSIPEEVLNSYSPRQFVGNYWKLKNELDKLVEKPKLGMKVYLSTNNQFTADFIIDEYSAKLEQKKMNDDVDGDDQAQEGIPRKKNYKNDNILLWEEPFIASSSLSKSFILAKKGIEPDTSKSFHTAQDWLETAHEKDRKEWRRRLICCHVWSW